MCGRMTLTRPDWDELLVELTEALANAGVRRISADEGAASLYRPRYNVAPAQPHPVLRSVGGHASLGFALWGLLARRRGQPPAINARAETAPFKPAFQEAFVSRRCVVPADGFFEWKSGPAGRQPLWLHRPDGKLLLLAGLFDEEPATTKQPARTRFAVLTTAPNRLLATVHDRMPALLSASDAATWLVQPEQKLLRPAPNDLLVATPVSLRVNSVRNDDPECLAPPRSGQMRLF
jgi:putative SOS response-associated peptidase YedK